MPQQTSGVDHGDDFAIDRRALVVDEVLDAHFGVPAHCNHEG
jgi:hypothetical protein